jgi:hypothetical protein
VSSRRSSALTSFLNSGSKVTSGFGTIIFGIGWIAPNGQVDTDEYPQIICSEALV